ncbi:MAG: aminotransferase class V-fold PLP-dependent enzyme, partial [Proteobacteria bacterium]|nr:aminotransferase class V-fold PLP-dependent enzyme [Pseudomonadota bacterium]
EIIFTSGGTESNNLAIKGVANANITKGKSIITTVMEHESVYEPCEFLKSKGFNISYLPGDVDGAFSGADVRPVVTTKTTLITAMHANNEVGTIQPIQTISRIGKEKGVPVHTDAVQTYGAIPVSVKTLGVSLMSFTAHKIYGPKGIGALYVRRKPRVRLEAQMHGGGHERGLRSGTLATHQIVGMGEAFRIAKEEMASENDRIRMLRDRLYQGLKDMEEVYVNGDYEQRTAGNLNISFNFVEGESLIMALRDLAVSSGSACTSASLEPSYVLRALGRNDELAHSSIRFTIGRFTTLEEIDYSIDLTGKAVDKLRNLSPLWDMYKAGIDLSSIEWAAH